MRKVKAHCDETSRGLTNRAVRVRRRKGDSQNLLGDQPLRQSVVQNRRDRRIRLGREGELRQVDRTDADDAIHTSIVLSQLAS